MNNRKRQDLTGQTFNRLTVIKLSPYKRGTAYLWECKCSCGTQPVYVTAYALTKGHTKSCGCVHQEQRSALGKSKNRHKPGEVLGHYKILRDTGKRIDGRVVWECECLLCGRTKEITSRSMRHEGKDMPLCDCEQTCSRGEAKIAKILNDNNIFYQREYQFSDLRTNGKMLRFDFRLEDGTLIEYDGIQHFTDEGCGFGEPIEILQYRDELKTQYCLLNKIPLIRIPYTRYDDLCLDDLLLTKSSFVVKEA